MIILEEYTVSESCSNIRLIDYLPGKFRSIPSRSGLKKAFKRGQILLDGALATGSRWVKPGQTITLLEDESGLPKIFELPLKIAYEDEFLAIAVKPSGYPVSGNTFRTIQNAILFNLGVSGQPDALRLPRPVHRLDVPTSGLLIVAKTNQAVINLGKQLANHEIKKRYRAVVAGKTPERGTIESAVNKQEAKTSFYTVRHVPSVKTGFLSLVDLFPETGRKHQLRIHMSKKGFPIVGDKRYCTNSPLLKGKGLFLSAVELDFIHPVNGKNMNVKIDQPDKFNTLLTREGSRWKKYN